jgi:hypothetical protein
MKFVVPGVRALWLDGSHKDFISMDQPELMGSGS